MKEIIDFIDVLVKNGSAYVVDGDVYFSVEADEKYGELSVYLLDQKNISATAKNGASITEKSVNGNAISGTSITMDAVETGEFVFEAKDSRGYTGMARVSKMLVEYIKLTETLSCTRDDPTSGNATLMVTGN